MCWRDDQASRYRGLYQRDERLKTGADRSGGDKTAREQPFTRISNDWSLMLTDRAMNGRRGTQESEILSARSNRSTTAPQFYWSLRLGCRRLRARGRWRERGGRKELRPSRLDRIVAVKVLAPDTSHRPPTSARFEEAKAIFRAHIRTSAAV